MSFKNTIGLFEVSYRGYTASHLSDDTATGPVNDTKLIYLKISYFGHKIRKKTWLLIQWLIDAFTVFVQCPLVQSKANQLKEQTISCIQSVLEQTLNLD